MPLGPYRSMAKFTSILKLRGIRYAICSVEGMNFDFVAMNLTGFLLYSVYNTYGYFVDST